LLNNIAEYSRKLDKMNARKRTPVTNYSNAEVHASVERQHHDGKLQPIVKFQFSRLQSQLEQQGASLAERDVKCQKQEAIIDALVQQLSDMEDCFNASHIQALDNLSKELYEVRQENKKLRGVVANLEVQLTEAKYTVEVLTAHVQQRHIQTTSTCESTDKRQEKFHLKPIPDNASSVSNIVCTEEQHVAVTSSDEDFGKKINSLQCNLTVAKREADVLKYQLSVSQQETKVTAAAMESRIRETAWVAGLQQRLVCSEEEKKEVERKARSDKALLEFQVSEAIKMIKYLKDKLEEAERKQRSRDHNLDVNVTESDRVSRRAKGPPAV